MRILPLTAEEREELRPLMWGGFFSQGSINGDCFLAPGPRTHEAAAKRRGGRTIEGLYQNRFLNTGVAFIGAEPEARGMYRDSFARQIAEVTQESRAEAAAGKAAEPEASEVEPRVALMLVELAHKLTLEPFETPRLGHPAVKIGQYWLDKRIGALAPDLVNFHHLSGGVPPLASLGASGQLWLGRQGFTRDEQGRFDPDALQLAADGYADDAGEGEDPGYRTDWLREEVKPTAAEPEEDDTEAMENAAEVLARVENLQDSMAHHSPGQIPDAASRSFASICEAAGVPLPWRADEGENAGCVFAANGAEVFTADQHRELPDALASARAGLAVVAAQVLGAMAAAANLEPAE